MYKLLRFSFFFLLFTLSLLASKIQYAPVMMGDIITFVPYSNVKVSLGSDKLMKEGEDIVLSANISDVDDVASYVWREGNKVINTTSTLSLKSFPVGTHNITITVIDINGLQLTDSIKVVIGSKEYVGKRTKAVLNNDNYIKFVRALNLIKHIKFKYFLSFYGEGVSAVNRIDDSTKVGYIVQNFTNYDYGGFAFYGKQNIRLNGYYRYDRYENSYKTDADFKFITNENNITIKAKMHTYYNNGMGEEYIDKYYIYDKKYNEHIEILDFNKEKPKLYLGSEGYVDINTSSENFTVLGKNDTNLSVLFKPEEALYETRYAPAGELNGEPVPYQASIYSPRRGQGTIKSILNGVNKDDLYFIPYQVSSFEPPKFYSNNQNIQLLEGLFGGWHLKYKLLNQNNDNIEINTEWYVNGIKVETPIDYELPNIYNADDVIKIVVTAKNGDMIVKREQVSTNVNYAPFLPTYTQLDKTYDIVYRTNSLEFDLDLLSLEYFNNIDISNSEFSWYIGSSYHYATILHNTEYNKVPTILASNYGYLFDELYLKIYNEDEIKVVKFNITLEKGDTGIKNLSNIIESIDEANITNNNRYISTHKVEHLDMDSNGLDDIIYTSETSDGLFLNVSYQNSNRTFDLEKIAINGSIYLGDFDGDGTIEALDFSYDENTTKIISLEKGNIHNVGLLSYMNFLDIKAVSDINNDGKDDLIIANNQEDKLYVYDDINNTLEKRLVGNNECLKILSIRDINNDGLKDIICTPSEKINYLYSNNNVDYFSSELSINYYLQNIDNSFSVMSRKYMLINNATYHQVSGINVFGAIMLDNSKFAVSLKDKDGDMLYTCDLNNDSPEPLSKTPTNAYQIDAFLTPQDINHDGLQDLISFNNYGNGQLNIFYQKQNFVFESDYSVDINSSYQLTDRFFYNAFLDDIDNDGSLEILTINGENKFSYINFK